MDKSHGVHDAMHNLVSTCGPFGHMFIGFLLPEKEDSEELRITEGPACGVFFRGAFFPLR